MGCPLLRQVAPPPNWPVFFQLSLTESLGLANESGRFIDLFEGETQKFLSSNREFFCTRAPDPLKVATPSGRSRADLAKPICGVRMSIMCSKWNGDITQPIISDRFSDSKA